jgi:hypothetical protein
MAMHKKPAVVWVKSNDGSAVDAKESGLKIRVNKQNNFIGITSVQLFKFERIL